MAITHAYTGTKADPADQTVVGKTKWNAAHIDLVGVISKSSDYPLAATDELCLVTGTTTITLPTAVGCAGKVYSVKRTGSGAVTIATTSAQTIDGAATQTIGAQYVCLTVVSDGANWVILSPGATVLTESALVLTDNTTADSAVAQHGLLQKLDGNPYSFPSGDGTWRNTNAYVDPNRDPFTEPMYGWTDYLTGGTTPAGGFGFSNVAITSGTVANSPADTANHPGIAIISSAGGANSGYALLTSIYTSTMGLFLCAGSVYEIIFRTAATMTNMNWWAGFHNSANATAPTYGTFFNVAGNTLKGTGINSGTTDTAASDYTMSGSVWYRGRIDIASDTSATFRLWTCSNGTLVWTKTIATNAMYVTAGLNAGIVGIDTAGGTHEILRIDAQRFILPSVLVR